jgi:hypothetical protein
MKSGTDHIVLCQHIIVCLDTTASGSYVMQSPTAVFGVVTLSVYSAAVLCGWRTAVLTGNNNTATAVNTIYNYVQALHAWCTTSVLIAAVCVNMLAYHSAGTRLLLLVTYACRNLRVLVPAVECNSVLGY